jgi:hypothetical protein
VCAVQRDDDSSNFEDPALRSAIRRAWSAQTAPPELHRQLAQITAAGQSRWYRHPIFRLAIAAVVLISVGLLTVRFGSHPSAAPVARSLPINLADNLIIRHDACSRMPDHHMPGLPRNDLTAIAVMLRSRLGYRVMSGEPSAANWQFAGASICPVGDCAGAHLIFKQADQDISVFSLPISVDPAAIDKGDFTMVEDGHPIVAFATKDAFYAVVGSSTDNSLSLATVSAMCDRLKPTVMPTPDAQPIVATADFPSH